MNKKQGKRILAFILCVTMSIPVFGASVNLTDVSDHWAASAIETLVNSGAISGYEDDTFKPDERITRAEFVTIINRSFGFTNAQAEQFDDVQSDKWYAQQLLIARTAGYFSGVTGNKANPDSYITREDAFSIIARIYNLSSAAALTYTDVNDISIYAQGAVSALVSDGIITGYGDGSIKPKSYITRAETAVILVQAQSKYGQSEPSDIPKTEATEETAQEETKKYYGESGGSSGSAVTTTSSRAYLTNIDIIDSTQNALIASSAFNQDRLNYKVNVQGDILGVLIKADANTATKNIEVYTQKTASQLFDVADSNTRETITYNDTYGGYIIPLSKYYDTYLSDYIQTAYISLTDSDGISRDYSVEITRKTDNDLVSLFSQKEFQFNLDGTEKLLPYNIYVPSNYDPSNEYPVIIALHGAGQRAQTTDMTLRYYRFATLFALDSEVDTEKESIIIVPHLNTTEFDWGKESDIIEDRLLPSIYGEAVYELLQEVKSDYSIDNSRIYLTGMSMGALGTWALALQYPDEWAAIITCAGFEIGAEDDLSTISHIPVYLGVGENDTKHYTDYTAMLPVLEALGFDYEHKFYPSETFLWTSAHFSWIPFYDDINVRNWLLSQTKNNVADSVKGTVIEEHINGTTTYLYISEDWKRDQNSAQPFIMIYGDEPFTKDTVKQFVNENGLDEILPQYNANVLFMNPANGSTWGHDDIANYVKAAYNIHHQNANYDYKAEVNGETVYAGFYGRFYLIAEGSGADFVNTTLLSAYDDNVLAGSRAVGAGNCLPTSIMLFGAAQAPTATQLEVLPAVLYDCDAAVVSYYENLNNDLVNPAYFTVTASGQLGNADTFKQGYSKMSSIYRFWINTKSDGTAEYRYYEIPDYDAMGIITEKLESLDTVKSGDEIYPLDAYVYYSDTLDKNAEVPLVVGLHGGGNSATFFAWSSAWPERAKEDGLIYVGIQNHDKLSGTETSEKINGIIDEIIECYNIDESRIYLTGFSQGGANTFTASNSNMERFAGIMPLDGVAKIYASLDEEGNTIISYLPTYYVAGDLDATPTRPSETDDDNQVNVGINTILQVNGLGDYAFDNSVINTYQENDIWGILFDFETQDDYDDRDTGYSNKITQGILTTEEDVPIVCLQLTTDMVHCTMKINSDLAWDFIKNFSRNPDGSISYGLQQNSQAALVSLEITDSTAAAGLEIFSGFSSNKTTYEIAVQSDIYGVLVKAEGNDETANIKIFTSSTAGQYGGSDTSDEYVVPYNTTYGGYVVPLSETYENYLKDANYSQTAYVVCTDFDGQEKIYTVVINRESDDDLIALFDLKTYAFSTTEAQYLERHQELTESQQLPSKVELEIPYYIYVPDDLQPGEQLPVVLALHGAGQRTQDSEMMLRRYRFALEFAESSEAGDNRCIIIVPQCATSLYDWGLPDQIEDGRLIPSVWLEGVYDLLQEVKSEYSANVDTNKIYCTGMSMGGMGTWAMALAYPDEWAAIMPCVGFRVGADDDFSVFADVAVRIGVSQLDSTYDNYPDVVEKMEDAGINFEENFYDANTFLWTTPHFGWIPFYADKDNLDWLFLQTK